MKYLKNWKLFEADDAPGSDDIKEAQPDVELEKGTQKSQKDSLQKVGKDLKEFIQKRQVVDDVFKNAEDDKDLRQKLQDSVYKNRPQDQGRNPYLQEYEYVMRMTRRVNKIKRSIRNDELKKKEIQNTINSLTANLADLSDKQDIIDLEDKISKNKDYLKKVDINLNKNKKQLSLDQTNYQKRKRDFETEMKEEQKRIENISK
jgi:hypothetical protein